MTFAIAKEDYADLRDIVAYPTLHHKATTELAVDMHYIKNSPMYSKRI